ncbi:MAG: hypothetical protein D6754_04305 [Alphaproteobacteria bacterium]|nr:MAG: hypothetical protein D6754_04305 [Alphaproteobacteria bacterium]
MPRNRDPLETGAQGFADIVTNLLAILVIVTLIALVLAASQSRPVAYAVDRPADTPQVFPLPPQTRLPGFTEHFLVSGGRLSAIRFDRLADAMAARALEGSGQIALLDAGWPEMRYENPPLPPRRDIGEYRIRLTLPEPGDLPERSIDELIAAIEAQSYARGLFPNFLVTPSGFALFTDIERRLVAARRCFRWVLTPENRITYHRKFYFFADFAARRCAS